MRQFANNCVINQCFRSCLSAGCENELGKFIVHAGLFTEKKRFMLDYNTGQKTIEESRLLRLIEQKY